MYTTSIGLLDQLRDQAASQSWVRFVELYTPLLHYWASRLPGMQEADVSDLVQDVFLVLLAKLPTFQYDPGQSFRGWLRTLLLNRWRDRNRARSRPVDAGRAAWRNWPAPITPTRSWRRSIGSSWWAGPCN